MKKKKLEIELLSDTCVSDGGIYNSAVDMDICHDDFGFPYIPGKRIKGCLRECALELNDWGAAINIEKIFGKQGNERGQVVIKNAYIKERGHKMEIIKNMPGTPLFHPQNVLNCHSYIRTQTALNYDTGVADDQSLRTIRVADKGLVFEAEILFLSEDPVLEDNLKQCLAVFRHIGVSRTRGLGEVKVTLLDIDSKLQKSEKGTNIIHVMENSTWLEYEIYLEEPVICKSVGEQEASSMDYIEGAKILGILGQRLKGKGEGATFTQWLQEGRIHCSNAYPAVDGKRLYEIPASVFSIKNDKRNYRNKIYSDRKTHACDEGIQLSQAKHCYVNMAEDGRLIRYSVEREDRYHHSRPKDKSIGRSLKGEEGSQLYQISSIKEGQMFRGFIEGDCGLIQKVFRLIDEDDHCMVGYGRNGEYGGCRIQVIKAGTMQENQKETLNSFYVLLKSPTIIYNDKAMYSTDVVDLQKEILENIMDGWRCEEQEMQVEKYTNITSVGGYNVTWDCRKPTIYAFDKGTVLVFHFPVGEKYKIRTGRFWIGERCLEGFGEIMVCPLADSGTYTGIFADQAKKERQSQEEKKKYDIKDVAKEDFVQKMLAKCLKEFLRYKASEIARDKKLKKFDSVLKPTVSNMMLMCRENDSVAGVWENCQKRFGKKAKGKDRKKECAESIIKFVLDGHGASQDNTRHRGLRLLIDEFEEKYNICGVYNESSASQWELSYLAELLTQIKYVVRQRETKARQGVADYDE